MRIRLLAVFSLILAVFGVLTAEARAQTVSLYLSPSSGSFLVGSVFTVSVFLNTEGNEINKGMGEGHNKI